MAGLRTKGILLVLILFVGGAGKAAGQYSPLLDEVDGIAANNGNYLILPAWENTLPGAQKHAYFVFPKYLVIARQPGGDAIQLGITHRGFTLFAGGQADYAPRANFTAAVEPLIDDPTVTAIKAALIARDKAQGLQDPDFPTAVFQSYAASLIINGVADPRATSSGAGGYVGQLQLVNFTVPSSVEVAFVEQLPANAGRDATLWGLSLKGKIKGYGNRLKCTLTAKHRNIYNHFKARATAQAFWGLAKADVSKEVQSMVQDGSIDMGPCRGDAASIDKLVMPIWNILTKEDVDGQALFVDMVKQTSLPDHPEAGRFGWGFSASSHWATVDVNRTMTVNFDVSYAMTWDFPVAMVFSTTCEKYKLNVINQTDPAKPCIDPAEIPLVRQKQIDCVQSYLTRIKKWKDDGIIDGDGWKAYFAAINRDGCGWTPGQDSRLIAAILTGNAKSLQRNLQQAVLAEIARKGIQVERALPPSKSAVDLIRP